MNTEDIGAKQQHGIMRRWIIQRIMPWLLGGAFTVIPGVLYGLYQSVEAMAYYDFLIHLLLAFFAGLCLFVLGLVIGMMSKMWQIAQLGIGMMGVCFLVFCGTESVIGIQYTKTCEVGGEIIQAIHRYQQEHSSYPGSLMALVPQYVQEIPTTKMRWGRERFVYNGPDPLPDPLMVFPLQGLEEIPFTTGTSEEGMFMYNRIYAPDIDDICLYFDYYEGRTCEYCFSNEFWFCPGS
jgi:hypothetical protein